MCTARIFIFTGYRAMFDNISNMEYDKNPSNRSVASERYAAHIRVYRQRDGIPKSSTS